MADYYTSLGRDAPAPSELQGTGLILVQWSSEILTYPIDKTDLFWHEFCTRKTDLEAKKGSAIHMPILRNLNTLGTAELALGTKVPIGTLPVERMSVSVGEYGNGIELDYAIDEVLSNAGYQNEVVGKASLNMMQSLNTNIYAQFLAAEQFIYQPAAGSTHIGSGAGTAGTGALNGSTLDAIYDAFVDNKVPKWGELGYILAANAKTLRGLKNSDEWRDYAFRNEAGQRIITNTMAKYKGFTIIETGDYFTTGTALAFGAESVNLAFGGGPVSLPVEIRYDPDYRKDFGRSAAWAWLAWWGIDARFMTKGTTVYRVYSAA